MDRPPGQKPTRLLIVEHEDIVRAGLRTILRDLGPVSQVDDPITEEQVHDGVALNTPDVVLLDDELPAADTPALISDLRAAYPGTVIVVLANSALPQRVLDAMGAGASAYLLKTIPGDQLEAAIQSAVAGAAFVDPEIAGQIVQSLARPLAAGERPDPLTPREREVLAEIARGRSNREIGYDLQVAAGTVKVHVERILRKLGAANRVEATTLGLQSGLIVAESLAVATLADPPVG